ncbi:MAG: DUF4250 domain-containing protein [Lachnospiraceae bacterium]|nr:DUF4250 domain-containing protein [Lachnospiraceae bacterium]
MMPNDPVMLLSYVNTQLRDHYESLQDFCSANNADPEALKGKLAAIDYEYDAETNQFV